MTVSEDTRGLRPACARAVLWGDLDIYELPRFRAVLEALAGDAIAIDMSRVRCVSAAFVTEIVRLRRRCPHSRIALVGLADFNRHVLLTVGLDAICSLA
jgi:anti-anti-sigma regulatory factor